MQYYFSNLRTSICRSLFIIHHQNCYIMISKMLNTKSEFISTDYLQHKHLEYEINVIRLKETYSTMKKSAIFLLNRPNCVKNRSSRTLQLKLQFFRDSQKKHFEYLDRKIQTGEYRDVVSFSIYLFLQRKFIIMTLMNVQVLEEFNIGV